MNMYAAERLENLIDHYMSTRRKPSIISTKMAARALTTFMSACPLSGRAFEDAIAGSAVKHGHAVAFDFADVQAQPRMRRQSSSEVANNVTVVCWQKSTGSGARLRIEGK